MTAYRTAANAYSIQSASHGSTGVAQNTAAANAAAHPAMFGPHVPTAALVFVAGAQVFAPEVAAGPPSQAVDDAIQGTDASTRRATKALTEAPTISDSITPVLTPAGAATYYVKNGGSDAASGLSDGTAWATIAKVNSSTAAGDTVNFKRGSIWRESLAPKANCTYQAYDSGNKPSIRGSNAFASTWTSEGGNLYYKGSVTADPVVFARDGVLGARKTLKASLGTNWDYWWDDPNDRLYVYHSGGDPSTQATLLEYGVRNRVLSDFATVSGDSYIDLDVRHTTGDIAWGSFGATASTFTDCDFSQLAGYAIQSHNGSGVAIDGCTFTDWGIRNSFDYAVQSIGFGTTDAGPTTVDDSTFTMTVNRGDSDQMAVNCDTRGWVRRVSGCTFTGNGFLADEAILIFRPATTATDVLIEDCTITSPGGQGVSLQELEYHGGTPAVTIRDTTITDSNQRDDIDREGIRLRNFTSACDVKLYRVLVDGTLNGTYDHDGIRVSDATGVEIYDSTIYGCDRGLVLDTPGAVRAPTATVKNVIVSGCRGDEADVDAGTLTEDHNDFHGSVSGFSPAGTTINADPLFGNAASGDFSLSIGSPAIDTGVAVGGIGQVVYGAAPDMGYLEQPVVMRALNDAIAGTDARSLKPGKVQADSIAGTDARTSRPTKSQADSIAGTDASTRRVTRVTADPAAGTDASTRRPGKGIAETSSVVTDARSIKPTKAIAETASVITDSLARTVAYKLPLSDSIAGTDASARAPKKALAEAASAITDSATPVLTPGGAAESHNQPDTIQGTDASTRRVVKAVADPAAGTDASSRRPAKALADTAAGTDQAARTVAYARTIADGASLTDSVQATGAGQQSVDDNAAFSDQLSIVITYRRTLSDSAAGTDASARAVAKLRAEQLAGTDQLARTWTALRAISDAAQITDDISATGTGSHQKSLSDALGVSDALSRAAGYQRGVTDSGLLGDASARRPNPAISETLAATDALERSFAAARTLAEALEITDLALALGADWELSHDLDWDKDEGEDWPREGDDDDWEKSADSDWIMVP